MSSELSASDIMAFIVSVKKSAKTKKQSAKRKTTEDDIIEEDDDDFVGLFDYSVL